MIELRVNILEHEDIIAKKRSYIRVNGIALVGEMEVRWVRGWG